MGNDWSASQWAQKAVTCGLGAIGVAAIALMFALGGLYEGADHGGGSRGENKAPSHERRPGGRSGNEDSSAPRDGMVQDDCMRSFRGMDGCVAWDTGAGVVVVNG